MGKAGIKIYDLTIRLAVRGEEDPADWAWYDFEGIPPRDDPERGAVLMEWGSKEVTRKDLNEHQLEILDEQEHPENYE